MAVLKTTETRCRDGSVQTTRYKDYTTSPIPTSFLYVKSFCKVMLRDYSEEQFLTQS